MKTDTHPQYNAQTQIHCSCGNVIVTGSTRKELKTELCSNCHPFYTGKQKLIDTAGRVDKFQAQRKKAEAIVAEKVEKKASRKKAKEFQEKEVPTEVLERAMASAKKKA